MILYLESKGSLGCQGNEKGCQALMWAPKISLFLCFLFTLKNLSINLAGCQEFQVIKAAQKQCFFFERNHDFKNENILKTRPDFRGWPCSLKLELKTGTVAVDIYCHS